MTPVQVTFTPIPTGEIPLPIVEGGGGAGRGEPAVPRILLETAGRDRAARQVARLTGLFLLFALLELGLYLRLPRPRPVIVYRIGPRLTLLGGGR